MDIEARPYRQIAIGEKQADAVTVGIEKAADGSLKASVWWESTGDVDADEAEYADVATALAAAEAARALHGLREVVIVLQDGLTWQRDWGRLTGQDRQKEPMGDLRETDLSEDETFVLAAGIEAERDA